jgi:hypothetical protein
MKALSKVLAILVLIIMALWEIKDPGYEPLAGIIGSILALIGLYGTDSKEEDKPAMKQTNKDKSTGYQAGKMTINNPKK